MTMILSQSSMERLSEYLIEVWPTVENEIINFAVSGSESMFSPRLMIRQLFIAVALQAGLASLTQLRLVAEKILRNTMKKGRVRNLIEDRMKKARTFIEWKQAAEELDAFNSLDMWRLDEISPLYDVKTLKKRMADIIFMLNGEDVFNMMYRLRGALSREQFGMTQPRLFSQAAGGTKVIIEEYNQLLISSLNYVCDHDDPQVYSTTKLALITCNQIQ